jgi:hypothetical protein
MLASTNLAADLISIPVGTASAHVDNHDDLLGYTQLKYYLQLNTFMTSISFVDLLYMLFVSSFDPSPQHARGLGNANK